MARPNPPRRGYTLTELVLLLGILGVLAAIAGPKYANSLALYRTQAAAQRIVADLNLARWQARATSAGQSVVFSVNTNAYSLPGVPGLAGTASPYTVKLASDPYQATLKAAAFPSLSTLTFDRFGQPSAGGTVVVQSGGFTKTVTVDANTGQASVQ